MMPVPCLQALQALLVPWCALQLRFLTPRHQGTEKQEAATVTPREGLRFWM